MAALLGRSARLALPHPGHGHPLRDHLILSLIPGFGDLASPIFTVVLLVQGLRQHVPRVVMVRMVVNALIDALIGAIPVAGNIGDIFWRANNLNLDLLTRHAQRGRPPTPGDYAFVWLIALVLGLLIPYRS